MSPATPPPRSRAPLATIVLSAITVLPYAMMMAGRKRAENDRPKGTDPTFRVVDDAREMTTPAKS